MRYSIRIVLCYDNGGSQRDRGQIFVFHHNAVVVPRVSPCIFIITTVYIPSFIHPLICRTLQPPHVYTTSAAAAAAAAHLDMYALEPRAPIILKFDSLDSRSIDKKHPSEDMLMKRLSAAVC